MVSAISTLVLGAAALLIRIPVALPVIPLINSFASGVRSAVVLRLLAVQNRVGAAQPRSYANETVIIAAIKMMMTVVLLSQVRARAAVASLLLAV